MSFHVHKKLRESLAAIRKDSYTPAHIAVLESLAYRINDKTGICFPSVQTIADESYLSERHTRKVLSQLEEDKVVEIVRRSRKSNHYRLPINGTENTDFPNDSAGENSERSALKPGQQALEDRTVTSEAPLTNNCDLSLKPLKEVDTSAFIDTTPFREMTPSESLLSETGFQTGEPVNKKTESSNATSLHSFLMKKVGSACPEPSAKDVRELSEAIEKYGIANLYQAVEWAYKRKDKFWRGKLKTATHPCSMLCRCMPTMMQQITEDEEKASRSAHERAAQRVAA